MNSVQALAELSIGKPIRRVSGVDKVEGIVRLAGLVRFKAEFDGRAKVVDAAIRPCLRSLCEQEPRVRIAPGAQARPSGTAVEIEAAVMLPIEKVRELEPFAASLGCSVVRRGRAS